MDLGPWLDSSAIFWAVYTGWVLMAVLSYGRPKGHAAARVRVVVAARDEAPALARSIPAWQAQTVDVDLVVVEGPSNDHGRDVARQLGARVLEMDAVPAGWVGKVYACHLGSPGDEPWILFADADVVPAPDYIAGLLHRAERLGADHVAAYPRQHVRTLAGQAFHFVVGAGMALMAPPWAVRRRVPGFVAGIGHGNLVRRSTYDAAGGHAAIRHELVDDVALGRIMRQAGARQDATSAPAIGSWGGTLLDAVRAMDKVTLAGIGSRWLVAVALLAFASAWSAGLLGIWLGHPLTTLAWAAPVLPALVQVAGRGWGASDRAPGFQVLAALLVPLAFAGYLVVLARALTRRTVDWRGTRYDIQGMARRR